MINTPASSYNQPYQNKSIAFSIDKLQQHAEIRELWPNDWEEYKRLRLEWLQDTPEAFGGSYEQENEREDREWIERLAKPDRKTMGVYVDDKLVAIMTIIQGLVFPDGTSDMDYNFLAGVYTDPLYRGTGTSLKLLDTLLDYTKKHFPARKCLLCVNSKKYDALMPAQKLYEKAGFHIYENNELLHKLDKKLDKMYMMILDRSDEGHAW